MQRRPEPIFVQLRTLVDLHRKYGQNITRVVNQIQGHLAVIFPEWKRVFSGIQGKSALWWLSHAPTPAHVVGMDLEELARGLGSGYSKPTVQLGRAKRLLEAASQSIGVPGQEEVDAFTLGSLVQTLEHLLAQKRHVEAEISRKLQECPELAGRLQSVPGIGSMFTAQILTYLGDLAGYDHYRQILRKADLNLTHQSSGKKDGQRRISKRGMATLRSVLYRATLAVIHHCSAMKSYFASFTERKKDPLPGKAAVVATAGKLVRALWHMARRGENHDPSLVTVPAQRAA